VTLTDPTFFTEFTRQFTPGTSLSFRLSLTGAVDPGGTPDQFSFAILQRLGPLLPGPEIPTTGPGDALLTIDIDSASPSVLSFPTDTTRTDIGIPAAGISAVPEPAATSFVVAAAMVLLAPWLAGRRALNGATIRRWFIR
jgi:hypothetical protein